MEILKKSKHTLFVLVIFLLPFIDFLKDNISEIDIILGKSFYFLIFIVFFTLFLSAFIVNLFFKTRNFSTTFLIIIVIYWVAFKHNFLNLVIKTFIDKSTSLGSDYSSEISLLILIILSIYISLLIYKNNLFFKRFIYIFFYLTFLISLVQIFNFNQVPDTDESSKINIVNFPDSFTASIIFLYDISSNIPKSISITFTQIYQIVKLAIMKGTTFLILINRMDIKYVLARK